MLAAASEVGPSQAGRAPVTAQNPASLLSLLGSSETTYHPASPDKIPLHTSFSVVSTSSCSHQRRTASVAARGTLQSRMLFVDRTGTCIRGFLL